MLAFKTLLMEKSKLNHVKLDQQGGWGLTKLQCRVFIGTCLPIHCPMTIFYVFFFFFFSCYQLLILQVADSADSGLEEGQSVSWGKEKVTRDLPAKWMPRNCSSGSYHCPLLPSWMFGSCVWEFPNPRARIFISQPSWRVQG